MAEAVTIAILAKAPIVGFAKTRLIPALGAQGAAALQARLIERTAETATTASLGPVVLWCAPDETHELFHMMAERFGVTLARQPEGDLGRRMLAAVEAAHGPVLVIGTDCPALTPERLHDASHMLRDHDAVVIPAEDGGYGLIGLRKPQPALFADMAWSTATVMAETRRRMTALGLQWRELPPIWDVDTPADFDRLKREGYGFLLTPAPPARA
jgi:rSAM/selenodomain-associated transferase 1